MGKEEKIRIAKIAIEKGYNYEELRYGDDMYGREEETDDVWDYVEECKAIGTIEFYNKYK